MQARQQARQVDDTANLRRELALDAIIGCHPRLVQYHSAVGVKDLGSSNPSAFRLLGCAVELLKGGDAFSLIE